MEEELGGATPQVNEADFERLQAELDEVGSELATLKDQAGRLLEVAQKNVGRLASSSAAGQTPAV